MNRGEKVIWAAGFFDGEGCVSVRRRKPVNQGKTASQEYTYVLVVTANQKARSPLEILQQLFGGAIFYHSHKENHCPMYTWQATTLIAAAMLREILPYLVVKQEQAEIALTFQSRRRPRGGTNNRRWGGMPEATERDRLDYEQMRSLKVGVS